MGDSVETLGVDLRTQIKQLGAKEKERRNKCDVRFSLTKRNEIFQKKLHEDRSEEADEDWLGPCESVERTGGCCTHRKAKIKEVDGGNSRKQESVSHSLFLEVNDLEVEEKSSSLATQAWAEAVWIGKWPAKRSVERADL